MVRRQDRTTMGNPRKRLRDIISEGVAIDVFQAQECLYIDDLIGTEADKINAATFGAFFGSLQIILGRYLILAVSRIYEKDNPRYPTRSIPAAINLLLKHADELVIEQKPGLIRSLQRFGFNRDEIEKLSDPELTKLVTKYFSDNLPKSDIANAKGLSKALNALKTTRDKVIAHHEAIDIGSLPRATYAEIDDLIEYAKKFVGTVGFAYLSAAYEDDEGNYFLSSNAGRAKRCLKRVLQAANVLPERSLDF